jgi:hypothetical protein
MSRDWEKNPPKNREDAFELAEHLAQSACDCVARLYGEANRPHTERRSKSVVVVWPDGMITNEIELEMIQ